MRSDHQIMANLDAALKKLVERVRTNNELQEAPLANDNGRRQAARR